MRHISHKWKAIIIFAVTGLVVFYVEIISYIVNSKTWVVLPSRTNSEPLRILIVADPQIIGERDEHKYLGYFTRWDADSYLKRTYNLAKNHVKPDVVIFLGDLFDEGTKASDAEYARYYSRFVNIFNVPRIDQSSTTTQYIFIPGDNDVGGENEPILDANLYRFNNTFGDFNEVVSDDQKDLHVQFMKYNQFFPANLRHPLNQMKFNLNQDSPNYRILLTHYSLLKFIFEPIQDVLKSLRLSLVLSAHSHESEYRKVDHGDGNLFHPVVTRKFLLTESGVPKRFHLKKNDEESLRYLQIHLDEDPTGQILHEISVPTCSYRMGVPNMGYGSMQIFQDGTVDYTVLWLPSRFTYLTVYQVYFVIMKLVTSPFIYWQLFKYALSKYRDYKLRNNKAYHSV